MRTGLQPAALAFGAAVAVAIAVPAQLIGQVVVADDADGLLFAVYVLVLVGFAVGGAAAARRAPDAPLSNAAVAALAAFAAVQAVGVALRLARGDDIPVLAVVFNGLLAYGAGLLGGAVAGRRRPDRSVTP